MNKLGLTFGKADVDALLANFVDNFSTILLFITLNLTAVGMPSEIVFGRMVPGAAIALILGNIYYVYASRKLAKKESREDVTALPCGVGVVYVLTYTTGILIPVSKITGDPVLAWRVCLVGNLLGAIMLLLFALVGPAIRKFLPSSAMLGTLGGLALCSIAGLQFANIFSNPYVGFPALAIIVWGYLAKGKMPFKLSPGLVSLIIGAIIAIGMGSAKINTTAIGFIMPIPWLFKVGFQAFKECTPYLGIIIPIAVVNFVITLNQLEGAKAVGDDYPVRNMLVIDALTCFAGAVFGSTYPTSLYSGHPAYKRMGARSCYGLGSGIILLLLAFFGLFEFMSGIFPIAAVTPILIFIGIINVEVAFTKSPVKHITATAMAFLPFISMIAKQQIDSAIKAVNLTIEGNTLAHLSSGINYVGFSALANGTIMIAMILAALVAFCIDRQMLKAAITSGVATICSFFGIIHASKLAFNSSPELTIAWFGLTIVLLIMHFANKNNTHGDLKNSKLIQS